MGPTADLHIASASILALVLIFLLLGSMGQCKRRFNFFAPFFLSVSVTVILGCIRSALVFFWGWETQTGTAVPSSKVAAASRSAKSAVKGGMELKTKYPSPKNAPL